MPIQIKLCHFAQRVNISFTFYHLTYLYYIQQIPILLGQITDTLISYTSFRFTMDYFHITEHYVVQTLPIYYVCCFITVVPLHYLYVHTCRLIRYIKTEINISLVIQVFPCSLSNNVNY